MTLASPTSSFQIRAARPEDAAAIGKLLAHAALPQADLAPHLETFLTAWNGGSLVGAVGLEISGGDALLRSLVVDSPVRGMGLGRALLRQIVELAKRRGVSRLYLLSTTATGYFEGLGFVAIDRAQVPAAVAQSGQFQGVCPASAACLCGTIDRLAV